MIPSDGRVLLPVTSPTPSAFPKSLWWVGFPESARTKRLRAEGISRSSPFLTFRPPGLFATQVSPTAAPKRPQGSRDFSTRANHTSLPMCASGMLAVRNRQLTAERLSLSQTCSLVGRYQGLSPSQTCSHVGRYQSLDSSGSCHPRRLPPSSKTRSSSGCPLTPSACG